MNLLRPFQCPGFNYVTFTVERGDEIWLSEEETKMDTLCVSKVVSNKLAPLLQKWMLVVVNEEDGVAGVNHCMVPE